MKTLGFTKAILLPLMISGTIMGSSIASPTPTLRSPTSEESTSCRKENQEEQWLIQAFKNTVDEEKRWAEYLFKDGSMIGLNDKLLHQYVEWVANRRIRAIGFKPIYDVPARNNPLPWTEHWISSKGLQDAPQETEVESYIVGGIKQDVKKDTFSGFKL